MRIIITGGTGFIGTALTKSLLLDGHQVWILTRNPQTAYLPEGARGVGWDGRTTNGWESLVSQVDAIVNLAGESLGSGSWTKVRKNRIVSSRVEAGRAVTEAIRKANPRPKVLIQASAVGFYGPHGSEVVTEDFPLGRGFLAEVCRDWEPSTQPVEQLGVRRVVVRTGVVLSKECRCLSAHACYHTGYSLVAHWAMGGRAFPGFILPTKSQASAFCWKTIKPRAFLIYPRRNRSRTQILDGFLPG